MTRDCKLVFIIASDIFFYLFKQVLGTLYRHVTEALLMSTHSIPFYGEIRKNYPRVFPKYSSLTSPLHRLKKFTFKCT